jgi:hypothetical protein
VPAGASRFSKQQGGKMKNLRSFLFIALILIVSETLAFAGSSYAVVCNSITCYFSDSIGLGGGFIFHQISGYCTECQQFVSITWRRLEPKPAPIGHVWDSLSGAQQPIYACPNCGKPFSEIKEIEDLIHCPKCHKPSLDKIPMMLYD